MIAMKELKRREGLNIPTQDYLLKFMRKIGMTEQMIEANRYYNRGQLYLSPAVMFGHAACMNIGSGEMVGPPRSTPSGKPPRMPRL